MLTDDGYRQLMKHAKRLAQEGHGELAQHLRDAIDLRAEVEALRGITPELPPRQPEGGGLPRYGLRYNGQSMPVSVPMNDGYWTPYHLAIAEVEALRADALKQVDCRQCKHATNRGCHSTALCERGELFEATPPWQFYDAARAAQGDRG